MKNIGNNTHKKLTLDRSVKDNTPKWIVPFLAGGWLAGLLLLYFLFNVTDITLWQTLKHLLVFSVVFTLIPYKWVVKIIPIDYQFVLILNFLALGPVCTSLFFMSNYIFAHPQQVEIVEITHYERGEGFDNASIILDLKGQKLKEIPKFRTFDFGYYADLSLIHI